MALGLPQASGGEDRTPVIKYDARAGRLFRVDRAQVNGSWVTNDVEVTPVFQAIMDLERIEIGWLYFPTGAAPEITTAPFGSAMPPKPSDKHRSGFRVHMLTGKQTGGDVREMASNAQVSIKGMDALHDAFLTGAKANPGKLPVVKLGQTVPVSTSGKGADGKPVSSTNYQPVWEIVKWVDRPAELTADGKAAAVAQAQPEPEPEPQPIAAPNVDEDF